MIDNQPSKLDGLKDFLPTESDIARLRDLADKADAASTPAAFKVALDALCEHANATAEHLRFLRSKAWKELY